jgi:hypothetical protein
MSGSVKKIPLKQIDQTQLDAVYLRKNQADTSSGKITANGFDANGVQITNVADATANNGAATLGQVKTLLTKGAYGGRITGYVKDSTTWIHNNANGVSISATTPLATGTSSAPLLYLVLATTTISSVTYQANSILGVYGTGPFTYLCDNTKGTFDASSAVGDPDGTFGGTEYQIMCSPLTSADYLLYQSIITGAWTEGQTLKWNPDYDTNSSSNDNIGRWEILGLPLIPVADKTKQGVAQIGDGIATSGGIISADLTTNGGLKFTGTNPNKQIAVDYDSNTLTITGSALSVKTQGAISSDASGIKLNTAGTTGTYYKVTTDAYGRVTSGTAYTTNFADDVNTSVRKRKTERFNSTALTSGSMTIDVAKKICAPSANTREDIIVSINGIIIENDLTLNAYSCTNDSKTVTFNRAGIGYDLDTTDIIQINYLPNEA